MNFNYYLVNESQLWKIKIVLLLNWLPDTMFTIIDAKSEPCIGQIRMPSDVNLPKYCAIAIEMWWTVEWLQHVRFKYDNAENQLKNENTA